MMHKVTLIAKRQGQQSYVFIHRKQKKKKRKKKPRSLALSKSWLENQDFHISEVPMTLHLLSEIDATISFIINSSREIKKAIFSVAVGSSQAHLLQD